MNFNTVRSLEIYFSLILFSLRSLRVYLLLSTFISTLSYTANFNYDHLSDEADFSLLFFC